MDRKSFSIGKLEDQGDDLQYWLSRPIHERLNAVEHLRETFYGKDQTQQGLQRTFSIVKPFQR